MFLRVGLVLAILISCAAMALDGQPGKAVDTETAASLSGGAAVCPGASQLYCSASGFCAGGYKYVNGGVPNFQPHGWSYCGNGNFIGCSRISPQVKTCCGRLVDGIINWSAQP
jgi:hypothetical protein